MFTYLDKIDYLVIYWIITFRLHTDLLAGQISHSNSVLRKKSQLVQCAFGRLKHITQEIMKQASHRFGGIDYHDF